MRLWLRNLGRAFGPSLLGMAYALALVADEHRSASVSLRALAFALAWAAPLGLALGACGGALARIRQALLGRPGASTVWATALLLVGWHLMASLVAMAAAPSLASEAWYARGGLRRLVQVLAADVAGPRALAALGGAALVGYLVGAVKRAVAKGCFWQVMGTAARPLRRAAAPLALALLGLVALAWPRRARGPSARPGVVLVGFASLGEGARGPELPPALEAFAGRATSFEQALVSSTDGASQRAVWVSGVEAHRWREPGVSPNESLLARLAGHGYRVAIVGDEALAGRLGGAAERAPELERWPLALEPLRPLASALALRLGVSPPTRRDQASAGDAVVRALRFVDADERPFALAVFLPEARRPFAGACARALDFADRSYRGRCKYRACPPSPEGTPLDEADTKQEIALHRGALACDDAAFERLLEGLHERGLEQTTIVAAFGEGGAAAPRAEQGLGGGHRLDDRALHAPLVIRRPGASDPSRRPELVRDLDLAPTVLELLGLSDDAAPGRSLVGALRGGPLAEAHAFAEAGAGDANAGLLGRGWALSTGRHRLVGRATRRGLAVELFDRHDDPEQKHDRSAERPELRDALREELLDNLLRDRALTLCFGHVVPRPPAAGPSAPNDAPADARHDRQVSLLDALQRSLVDRRESGAVPGAEMSTLPPDPWALASPHPARRRVTLGPRDGRRETRTALVVPAPSTLRIPLRPGRRARLRVAPAPLAPPDRPVGAEVLVWRRGVPPESLGTFTLGAAEADHWVEREIDLGRFAGVDVELELRALAAPADNAPALAWGAPSLVEAHATELPYNIVLVALGGLDGSYEAPRPGPRDATSPAPRQPALRDATSPGAGWLASNATSFADFVPAATWRVPEELAALAGMRSGELGLDVGGAPPSKPTLDAFYARRPPLLAPRLRAAGATTLALRAGEPQAPGAGERPDLGFDLAIEGGPARPAAELADWIERHQRERFFVLAQLDAGHVLEPGDAPSRVLDRLEGLLEPLQRLGLARETVVAVMAGGGAPKGAFDEPRRFVRGPSLPLVFVAPGRTAGAGSGLPVHTTDIAPTLLALEGLAVDARMSGRALFDASASPESFATRTRVTEGRGARSLREGPFLYVERDARAGSDGRARSALFDVREDATTPRERSGERPDVAERLRDELAREVARHRSAEAAQSEALAGSRFTLPASSPRARVRLRFYGGAERHRVTLRIEKPAPGPGQVGPTLRVAPVELDPDVLHEAASFVDAAFVTRSDRAAGFDLEIAPSTTPLSWHVTWDDRPLEGPAWLAGPYGLSLPALRDGLRDEATRRFAEALAPPADLSPGRDEGVLVLWQELIDDGPALR